jgi:hypothetical protein
MVKEKLMPLMTAVKEVLGYEIAYNTIWAWQKLGVSGVKLKSHRVENKLVTSVEAVRRFHVAVSKIKGNRIPRILQRLDQPEHEFPIEAIPVRVMAVVMTHDRYRKTYDLDWLIKNAAFFGYTPAADGVWVPKSYLAAYEDGTLKFVDEPPTENGCSESPLDPDKVREHNKLVMALAAQRFFRAAEALKAAGEAEIAEHKLLLRAFAQFKSSRVVVQIDGEKWLFKVTDDHATYGKIDIL